MYMYMLSIIPSYVLFTVLLRVQVSLVDTIVNVCQDGADTNTNELGIHVNK